MWFCPRNIIHILIFWRFSLYLISFFIEGILVKKFYFHHTAIYHVVGQCVLYNSSNKCLTHTRTAVSETGYHFLRRTPATMALPHQSTMPWLPRTHADTHKIRTYLGAKSSILGVNSQTRPDTEGGPASTYVHYQGSKVYVSTPPSFQYLSYRKPRRTFTTSLNHRSISRL